MTVIHRRNEKQILCKIWARVFVCFDGLSVAINYSDGSRWGARLPPYFWTKLWPEENFFQTTPPPLSKGLDDHPPPPYLRVWIRHWLNSFLRDNCRKFPTGEICSQSENNIYFSLPICESRHIILSVWRLGGDLIHFFTDFYNFSLCYLFFTSPVYHIYALLKFSLGTWRKIVSVLSRFSLMPGADYMPDYLKKLN